VSHKCTCDWCPAYRDDVDRLRGFWNAAHGLAEQRRVLLDRVSSERDEARAESERLRAALGDLRRQVDECELDALRARDAMQMERDEARGVLAEVDSVLDLMDAEGERAKYFRDVRPLPEDRLVLELCERHGHGAVIDSACRQYFLKDHRAAFVQGPCAGTLRTLKAAVKAAIARPTDHVPSYPGPSDACGYCGKLCIKGEVCPARPKEG
jgi:hypothetical protein